MININNNRNNRNRRAPSNKNRQPAPRGQIQRDLSNVNSYNPVKRTVPYKHKTRKRPSRFKIYLFRFLLMLCFTAILFAVFAGLFYLYLTRVQSPPNLRYTVHAYILGADGELEPVNPRNAPISVNMPHEIGLANNIRYFPINELMTMMGFIKAGDNDRPSFIRRNPDEYLTFEIGAPTARVNGAVHHLPAPAFRADDDIYVPLDFLLNAFGNISLQDNALRVVQTEEPYLRINAVTALTPIVLTPDVLIFLSQHGLNIFLSDLSEFERYFEPPADELHEYLILVNQTNPLDPDFHPADLVDVIDTRGDRAVQQLRLYPARALEAMLIEARAHGHTNMTVTSGFRTFATQNSLFNNNVAQLVSAGVGIEEATARTAFAIAHPGQSEHQTGLAVDVHSLGGAAQEFGRQPDGRWLAQNAHHFGFILRYPEGKEHITGIQYEPWHFRYVGRTHATRIFNSGLTFEEYHEQFLRD